MTEEKAFPKYKCHKEVSAFKIKEFRYAPNNDSYWIIPEEEDCVKALESKEYFRKHRPEIGGYYVVYKDGYSSYSPEKAFEDGYTKI